MMKYIYLTFAAMLLLCLAPMPYGYYMLVRYVAMFVFGVMAYQYYEKEQKSWAVTLGALALLFQPFVKIALGRTVWNIVDVVVALLVVCAWWKEFKNSLDARHIPPYSDEELEKEGEANSDSLNDYEWWDKQFDPSPFGVISQTSFHEQASAVAAIEQYVRSELNDKPIQWARPYDLKDSHCQLSFTCDGVSYDVLVEIHSYNESKCCFVMKSEFDRLIAGCKENHHIPCILALDEDEDFISLTLFDDNAKIRVLK